MTGLANHRLTAAILLGLIAAPASADTVATGYGAAGDQLNPSGMMLNLPRDPEGLSQLDEITRTPTGLLYPVPFLYPKMTQSRTDPDWWSTTWFAAGLLGGGARSAQFRQYGDWSNGLLFGSVGFLAENRKTALYVSALGQDIGRADQFYQVTVGRYGVFRLTAIFDSIPHVFSTDAKSIWDGAGTGLLTLRDGLTAGSSTVPQVDAVAAAVVPTELHVTRQKAGVALSYTPYKELEAFLQVSNEWRTGTQPISATFGYPFQNGATQIIQPIHYRTLDVTAALRYREDDFQANLTYVGSYFRNGILSLTWQNPGLTSLASQSYIPPEGRLSLPPNNNYHSLKGDVAALLSPHARFTASVSYSLMRQDDALLPPTVDTGFVNGIGDLSFWNSASSLSRARAKAAIDIFNGFAQFQYTFSPDFSVNVELRDRTERNGTNYVAFNPLTGQYGYIAIDGGLAAFSTSLSGVYQPNAPGSVVQIRNMPFANDNLEVSATAAYRIDNHVKLDLSFTHNAIHHTAREVPDANDNRARIQLATNGYSWGTLRMSYEYARLTGSEYTSNPYVPYYSQSLPGYVPTPGGDAPFALDDLRKFDIADRTEQTLHAQANYILTRKTDVQLTGDLKTDGYEARYGLRSTMSADVNAAFDYQMSLDTTFTGYASYQDQTRGVANINATGSGSSGAAGGTFYAASGGWYERLVAQDYAAGLNAQHRWNDVTLTVNYTFTRGDSALSYSYAGTAAFFNFLTPAQAGSAFPDIVYDSHSLEANLLWQYTSQLSYRFYYRFDYQNLTDFHYAGLSSGVISNNYYLGVVPENFAANIIGAFVQYTF